MPLNHDVTTHACTITLSRWPKFFAPKHPEMKGDYCHGWGYIRVAAEASEEIFYPSTKDDVVAFLYSWEVYNEVCLAN